MATRQVKSEVQEQAVAPEVTPQEAPAEQASEQLVVVSATGDQKLPRETDLGQGFVRFDW